MSFKGGTECRKRWRETKAWRESVPADRRGKSRRATARISVHNRELQDMLIGGNHAYVVLRMTNIILLAKHTQALAISLESEIQKNKLTSRLFFNTHLNITTHEWVTVHVRFLIVC